jgi:hypothetical protein
MSKSGVLVSFATCFLLGLNGCSSPKFYPVKGKVIVYETGKYLTEGEVRFQPVSNPALTASGKINRDGIFSLTTPGHEEGVLEGACRGAVIAEPKAGQAVIDQRFQNFDTSELRYTVTARSENYFIIEVHKSGR